MQNQLPDFLLADFLVQENSKRKILVNAFLVNQKIQSIGFRLTEELDLRK